MLRSAAISDSVRVLLLALCDDMTEAGQVSVPRSRLATRLGRSERRVSERLEQAVEARLLDRVQTGTPGRTAVYAALLATEQRRVRPRTTSRREGGGRPPLEPIPLRGRTAAPIEGADGRPPAPRSEGGGRGSRQSNEQRESARLLQAVPSA
ncbi:MAG: hypothetical protein JWM64_244 [Frankiales bacterium]|nr:hypothetical protein [Frankiales bacterium]